MYMKSFNTSSSKLAPKKASMDSVNLWSRMYNLNKSKFYSGRINSRWKSWNACYHLVQNLLSSSLLSRNLKIKKFSTIIFPVVFNVCEIWLLTLTQRNVGSGYVRIGC